MSDAYLIDHEKDEILDALGKRIISGEWLPSHTANMDELAAEFNVARSVIREAIKVLVSLRLVESRRHKGTTPLASQYWDALAPKVISWRLDDPRQRDEQFRSLIELRSTVEPHAAQLAAQRCEPDTAKHLIDLATAMYDYGTSGDIAQFIYYDLEFHRLILQASHNSLFVGLERVITEILAGKYRLGLMPITLDIPAMQHHIQLAKAIRWKRPRSAYRHSLFIVDQSATELIKASQLK